MSGAAVLQELASQQWAIMPATLHALLDQVRADMRPTSAIRERQSSRGSVAVMPLYGVIRQRAGGLFDEFFGGTSTDRFAAEFRRFVADDGVDAIVIDVDSPGGFVGGVPELADEIFRHRGRKPVIAVANSLMASAAYWIASQADTIVASPSSQVGSIGVFGVHEDLTQMASNLGMKPTIISAGKFKTEWHPLVPVTDVARAAAQSNIDAMYTLFVNAVARGRKVSAAAVRNGYGEGRVVGAQEAVRLGMADRVGTLPDAMTRAIGSPLGRPIAAQFGADADTEQRYWHWQQLAGGPQKDADADRDLRQRRHRLLTR